MVLGVSFVYGKDFSAEFPYSPLPPLRLTQLRWRPTAPWREVDEVMRRGAWAVEEMDYERLHSTVLEVIILLEMCPNKSTPNLIASPPQEAYDVSKTVFIKVDEICVRMP